MTDIFIFQRPYQFHHSAIDPGVNNFQASQACFTKSRSTCIVRGRGRSRRLAELPTGELASWPRSLFAEWGSSCALALCAYRGPHLTNSSENKLQQPLTGVLTTSQISTFSSENKWKSRVLWEVWGRHRGGSSALQVSYCHSFVVYPWTLDKVKVKQSTFQLKFYLFLIWSVIPYNKSSTHVQKKIRKITWIMKQASLSFWNIHLLTSNQ